MSRRNQRRMKNKKRKLVIKDKKAFVRSVSILVIIIALCITIIVTRKAISSHFTSFISSVDVFSSDTEDIENTDGSKNYEPKVVEDATFTMAVTGDIMCHNTQYQDAYDASTGEYDFSYVFEDIKRYIQTADIAVGNLETTFAGSEVRI